MLVQLKSFKKQNKTKSIPLIKHFFSIILGVDWLANFMKQNILAIRTPEATSIARQTGFNRPVVDYFSEVCTTNE